MSAVANNRNGAQVFRNRDSRIMFLTAFFFFVAGIIILKFFNLQIISNDYYLALSNKSHSAYKSLIPVRGEIFVKEGERLYPIVANRDYYLVFADPRKINNVSEVIDKLTPILNLKEEEWESLAGKLKKANNFYEPIKNKVTRQQVEEIEALKLEGIYNKTETFRYYPEENFSGQVLGFIGYPNKQKEGNYGIEGYFEKELVGKEGEIQSVKDAWGSLVTIGDRKVEKAVDGADLVLTIDKNIQIKVCQKIKEATEGFKAESGTIIVMEPNTGAIIAVCSWPNFNPDKYNEVEDINVFNNPAIFYDYEPGSVFKAFTVAAALDLDLIEPDSTYEDTGEVKLVGQKPIRNSDLKAHGIQTMTQVLEKSLNTGVVYVVDKIGKKNFKKYVEKFGFGKKTGITLDTEVPGNISSLDKHGEVYTLTASFGQGITATPIQLISAFSALANGGKLMKPYIVAEIINSNGEVAKTQPQIVSQVITAKTSATIKGMLVSVIENGWGNKAGVPGYYVAGKSGTAEVAVKGGGYGTETMHTFIGFAPVNDPKFAVLVKLERPKAVKFSSDSAALTFSQISKYLLDYYRILPER